MSEGVSYIQLHPDYLIIYFDWQLDVFVVLCGNLNKKHQECKNWFPWKQMSKIKLICYATLAANPSTCKRKWTDSKPALMLKCLDSFAITDRIMLQPVYPLKYFNVYYVYCLDQKVMIESFQWNNCSYI